jgi:hypothetical protein
LPVNWDDPFAYGANPVIIKALTVADLKAAIACKKNSQ